MSCLKLGRARSCPALSTCTSISLSPLCSVCKERRSPQDGEDRGEATLQSTSVCVRACVRACVRVCVCVCVCVYTFVVGIAAD